MLLVVDGTSGDAGSPKLHQTRHSTLRRRSSLTIKCDNDYVSRRADYPEFSTEVLFQDEKMMFRLLFRPQRAAAQWKRSLTTSASEPLRILFCGSDEFSCASLKALHAEHETNKSLVESLEVMVLPGKRTGRGFKQLREGMYVLWLVRISLMVDSAL